MIARIGLVLVISTVNSWGGTLSLTKAFVEKVKNTAVIETTFSVDHTLKKPHKVAKGGDDGDIHAAGRDTAVRLPMVVEITNAGLDPQKPAMDAMKAAEGDGKIPMAGIWRVWFEHAGKKPLVQGDSVLKPTDTNPDHVFELHPLTTVNGSDCIASFQPIPEYDPYTAEEAFGKYEKLTCAITATKTAIQIESKNAGFNHTKFRIEPVGKPKKGQGRALFVLANVFDIENEDEKINESPVRIVFLEGTPAADAVANLPAGERMNLLGIPRVDLNKVSAIAKSLDAKEVHRGPLPYEIIVVAEWPE